MAELPAIGNLIQLNNYSLHAYQMGEGNPTVVFVSGAGNDCLIWQLVQPQVAQFTSTLSYDRAGLGGVIQPTTRVRQSSSHRSWITCSQKPAQSRPTCW